MIVHDQLSLSENIAAVQGGIEKYRGLGVSISAEGMVEVERKLHIIASQARALTASRDALIEELLEEDRLARRPLRFELPPEVERRGAPSRRLAWVRDQVVETAGAITRPGASAHEAAHWMRYLASHLYAIGEEIETMEPPAPMRPVSSRPRAAGRALLRLVSREGVRS